MDAWQPLLAPINGAEPGGEDLSFSVEFDEIAEMRRADDPSLSQGAWVATLKVADWPGVAAACERLMKERTKDLRLTIWMIEAWAQTRGFSGLADGLRVASGLVDRYWADLHPRIEDGDAEQRIGNLAGLLQRVAELASILPVTQGSAGAHGLRAWRNAQGAPAGPERGADHPEGDRVTIAVFEQALRATPAAYLQVSLKALDDARAVLRELEAATDRQLGADGPSFSPAREALDAAAHDLTRLARLAGVVVGAGTGAATALAGVKEPAVDAGAGDVSAAAGGPPRSRAQALQQLRQVADYFRRTEPHSPVAYLAEKAVAWGDMPLHQWLRTVLKDPGALAHVEELLGVPGQPAQG